MPRRDVDADIANLKRLLDADYFLVPITAYVQPKDEWLDVIRSGEFDDHMIDIEPARRACAR